MLTVIFSTCIDNFFKDRVVGRHRSKNMLTFFIENSESIATVYQIILVLHWHAKLRFICIFMVNVTQLPIHYIVLFSCMYPLLEVI